MDEDRRTTALESLTGRWLKQGFALLQGGGLFLRKVANDPTSLTDGRIWHKGSSLYARLNGATETIAVESDVVLESLFAAKGDLLTATADDTPAILTVGANDTILMADSGQANGLKWVAPGTPIVQGLGDTAFAGTADNYARSDHRHGMPTGVGTRYIDLEWDDVGGATKASDTHGGIGGFGTHLDMADGTDYTINFQYVTSPQGYSSQLRLELWMTAAAGGGNFVFNIVGLEPVNGATGQNSTFNLSAQVKANAAVANTMTVISFNAGAVPTAGAIIGVQVKMVGSSASDTVNAQRTLWKARLRFAPVI